MATDGPPPPDGPPRRIGRTTSVYIGAVTAVGLVLTAAALRVDGLVLDQSFVVLSLLAVLTWWSGPVVVDDRVRLSFSSILLLAAMAMLGPAGAGIVGIILGPLQRGHVPLRARVFNTGMTATLGVAGGLAYVAAGGVRDSSDLVGARDILQGVGIPILVADLVQVVVNLVLLAGVIRVAGGVPMRTQIVRLLGTTGPAYVGYGVIAFLLVVLWQPAKLGPASVVLVLAPLFVARWAYVQYAEEVHAHGRALHVLVAAVEAKAPHLAGHSARVAELSALMAESLGLRGQVVNDTRVAGMLHDLGQTTLPTALVRGLGSADTAALPTYPARGAALLRDLSFLSGSLDAIAGHRDVLVSGTDPTVGAAGIPACIVGLADEYDLLTEVGTPGGALLGREEALERLREVPAGTPDLIGALEHALTRRGSGVPA